MSFDQSLRKYAIYLLRKYNIRPKKSLGQSFLVDIRTINRIIEYANLSKDDIVLEIGGGLGFLTKKIGERVRKVITIEIDKKLIEAMKEVLDGTNNVEIIHGDALRIKLPRANKVVSNLPYSISTQITFKLLRDVPFQLAVLTYQKEVAQRILARPGSEDYGRLTIMVQLYATTKHVLYIPRYCFHPIPKVDSVTLRIKRREIGLSKEEIELFEDIVRELFTQRNKLWKKVLRIYLIRKGINKSLSGSIVEKCSEGVIANRVRELTIPDLVKITKTVKDYLDLKINCPLN